jgi:PadR family transcriptional regulator PadR
MRVERDLMRGAGPVAVMQLLGTRERYGYELVDALAKQTNGVLAIGQSTLYPLLYNLEAKGLVASRLDDTSGRPRRYYRLTDKGRRRLAHDLIQWRALLSAMQALGLVASPAGGAQ